MISRGKPRFNLSILLHVGLKLIVVFLLIIGINHQAAGTELSVDQSGFLHCFAGLEKKVSFDLRDADVVTIIDLLARESGANIVISPHVQGHITIRLENVKRWDALRYIIETMHLLMKQDGCVLRIYAIEDLEWDKKILEARLNKREMESEQLEKEAQARRKIAEAQLAEQVAAPILTQSVSVKFVDGEKLAEDLQKLHINVSEKNTDEPSKIDKRFITYNADADSILIRDTEKNLETLIRLIRELDRETRQVHIEAKIIETNRNFKRDLGIQWGFLSRGITDRKFPATWGIQGGHQHDTDYTGFLSSPLSGAGNWIVNFPFNTTESSMTGSALGMTFSNIANTFALDMQISAAEQNNDVRILSNPRILTSDNKAALIKSGVEVPFQTVEDNDVKIEFREAVIQLEATPHIVSDKMINLEIRVKKDEVDELRTVAGNPFFFKKEAKTSILMKDGETLVIGGLSKNRSGNVDRGVPLLSRIPILKHLFAHTRNIKEFEEIMVFITPKIARRLVSESESEQ